MDKDNSRPASGGSYTRKSASDKPVLVKPEAAPVTDTPAKPEPKSDTGTAPARVPSGKKE